MDVGATRILVYLSHPELLDVTQYRLRLLGFDAVPVSCCSEMEDALGHALPDLVIIDLDLEDGKGMRWVESVACNECTAHVPILCMSTEGDLQEAEEAYKAGARGFLIVPYDPVQLEDKIYLLLEQAREAKLLHDQAAGNLSTVSS